MNWTVSKLEDYGRTMLSKSFCMREMLHSEIAQVNGFLNVPSDPELAVYAGSQLCQKVLEPIQEAWGRVIVRSAYRSEEVNAWGNANDANCAANERNYAGHIWDRRDADGFAGAIASIVVPRYLDYYEETGDWASLAWWVHHHVPGCQYMVFFPKQCAFNVRWYEDESAPKTIRAHVVDPHTGSNEAILSAGMVGEYYRGMEDHERYQVCSKLRA